VVLSQAATATATGVTLTITRTTALAAPIYGTALTSAYAATAGTIQTFVDTQVTGNVLVVSNDVEVETVPPTYWLGFNRGVWSMFSPAALAAAYSQYFLS
jgi:regulator of RNase E activity RraA